MSGEQMTVDVDRVLDLAERIRASVSGYTVAEISMAFAQVFTLTTLQYIELGDKMEEAGKVGKPL